MIIPRSSSPASLGQEEDLGQTHPLVLMERSHFEAQGNLPRRWYMGCGHQHSYLIGRYGPKCLLYLYGGMNVVLPQWILRCICKDCVVSYLIVWRVILSNVRADTTWDLPCPRSKRNKTRKTGGWLGFGKSWLSLCWCQDQLLTTPMVIFMGCRVCHSLVQGSSFPWDILHGTLEQWGKEGQVTASSITCHHLCYSCDKNITLVSPCFQKTPRFQPF